MKPGDYVRTKNGYISKYIGKNKTPYTIGEHLSFESTIIDVRFQEKENDTMIFESELKKGLEEITNSSSNILDLLEKNDLVVDNYGNIYVVDYVFDNYIYTTTKQGNIVKTLCDYQIKSIVTHEHFESMEYEVGE